MTRPATVGQTNPVPPTWSTIPGTRSATRQVGPCSTWPTLRRQLNIFRPSGKLPTMAPFTFTGRRPTAQRTVSGLLSTALRVPHFCKSTTGVGPTLIRLRLSRRQCSRSTSRLTVRRSVRKSRTTAKTCLARLVGPLRARQRRPILGFRLTGLAMPGSGTFTRINLTFPAAQAFQA